MSHDTIDGLHRLGARCSRVEASLDCGAVFVILSLQGQAADVPMLHSTSCEQSKAVRRTFIAFLSSHILSHRASSQKRQSLFSRQSRSLRTHTSTLTTRINATQQHISPPLDHNINHNALRTLRRSRSELCRHCVSYQRHRRPRHHRSQFGLPGHI